MVQSEREQELFSLNLEINKLTKELESTLQNVHEVEEDSSRLKSRMQQLLTENSRLDQFKTNLLISIRDHEEKSSFELGSSLSPSPIMMNYSPRDKLNDGKKFFTDSKSRLSYENFSRLLAYVKQFNDKFIERDQLLNEVSVVFGRENRDLYEDFSILLSRSE